MKTIYQVCLAILCLAVFGMLEGSVSAETTALSNETAAAPTAGNTITVDTTSDSIAIDGRCSIREAIIAADSNVVYIDCPAGDQFGTDTIMLPSGVIVLDEGRLEVTSPVKFQGAGQQYTYLDGNNSNAVFYAGEQIDDSFDWAIHDLSIRNSSGSAILMNLDGGLNDRLTIRRVTMEDNNGGAGAALFNTNDTRIYDSYLYRNQGTHGTIYNTGLLVVDETIIQLGASEDNGTIAAVGGGAIHASNGDVFVANSTLVNNSSDENGGALYVVDADVRVTNSTLTANKADRSGGALYKSNSSGGSLEVRGSTISNNIADYDNNGTGSGGGFANLGFSSAMRFYLSIIALNDDRSPSFGNYSDDCFSTAASLGYNLVGVAVCSGFSASGGGSDMLGTDPKLGVLSDNGGVTNTLMPAPDSPAVDAATDNCDPLAGANSQEDQRGEFRPINGKCDIGAVEYRPSGIRYVDADAPIANPANGLSWDSAYKHLRDAVQLATSGDEIWVAAGTYTPSGLLNDRTTAFHIRQEVAVYGGFRGNETQRSQRNSDSGSNNTILSGDDLGNNADEPTTSQRVEDSHHVVTFASAAGSNTVLDGFTIRDGNANGVGDYASGAGIWMESSSPMLANLTLKENVAQINGGGLYAADAFVNWNGLVFEHNEAYNVGGAAYFGGGRTTLTGIIVRDNFGSNGGGIAAFVSQSFSVQSAEFNRNIAGGDGGALLIAAPDPSTISDTVFIDNLSIGTGGAIKLINSDMTFDDLTFRRNEANYRGTGGALHIVNSSTTMLNSVAEQNNAHRGGFADLSSNASLIVRDSIMDRNFTDFNEDPPNPIANNGDGGTIFVDATSEAVVIDSTIESGWADGDGGAVYTLGETALINSRLLANRAVNGGAVMVSGDVSRVTGSGILFVANDGFNGGAIGTTDEAFVFVRNITTADNNAVKGSTIRCDDSTCIITNSILWDSLPVNNANGSTASISYSTVRGSYSGLENQSSDPLLLGSASSSGDGYVDVPTTATDESANNDYGDQQLGSNSPAIDEGSTAQLLLDSYDLDNDNVTLEFIPYDLGGGARVTGPEADMGAYEFGSAPTAVVVSYQSSVISHQLVVVLLLLFVGLSVVTWGFRPKTNITKRKSA